MAGLNLSKPGPKEYAIVGGSALVLFLVYKWWKNRQTTAAAATPDTSASDTGNTAPSTPTGLSTSQFLAWIQDHSSSTTTKTTGGGGGTTTTRPAPKAGTPDYWGLATDLAKKTNPNPTHAEIEAQYRKITPKAQQKKEEAFNKKKAAAK
jgi:hypothetical protein